MWLFLKNINIIFGKISQRICKRCSLFACFSRWFFFFVSTCRFYFIFIYCIFSSLMQILESIAYSLLVISFVGLSLDIFVRISSIIVFCFYFLQLLCNPFQFFPFVKSHGCTFYFFYSFSSFSSYDFNQLFLASLFSII